MGCWVARPCSARPGPALPTGWTPLGRGSLRGVGARTPGYCAVSVRGPSGSCQEPGVLGSALGLGESGGLVGRARCPESWVLLWVWRCQGA